MFIADADLDRHPQPLSDLSTSNGYLTRLQHVIHVGSSGDRPEDRMSANRTPFEMEDMANSCSMVINALNRSIYICDPDNICLWEIKWPGSEVICWNFDGNPCPSSISPNEDLVVTFKHVLCYSPDDGRGQVVHPSIWDTSHLVDS